MEAQPSAFLLTDHLGVKGAVPSQSSHLAWGEVTQTQLLPAPGHFTGACCPFCSCLFSFNNVSRAHPSVGNHLHISIKIVMSCC